MTDTDIDNYTLYAKRKAIVDYLNNGIYKRNDPTRPDIIQNKTPPIYLNHRDFTFSAHTNEKSLQNAVDQKYTALFSNDYTSSIKEENNAIIYFLYTIIQKDNKQLPNTLSLNQKNRDSIKEEQKNKLIGEINEFIQKYNENKEFCHTLRNLCISINQAIYNQRLYQQIIDYVNMKLTPYTYDNLYYTERLIINEQVYNNLQILRKKNINDILTNYVIPILQTIYLIDQILGRPNPRNTRFISTNLRERYNGYLLQINFTIDSELNTIETLNNSKNRLTQIKHIIERLSILYTGPQANTFRLKDYTNREICHRKKDGSYGIIDNINKDIFGLVDIDIGINKKIHLAIEKLKRCILSRYTDRYRVMQGGVHVQFMKMNDIKDFYNRLSNDIINLNNVSIQAIPHDTITEAETALKHYSAIFGLQKIVVELYNIRNSVKNHDNISIEYNVLMVNNFNYYENINLNNATERLNLLNNRIDQLYNKHNYKIKIIKQNPANNYDILTDTYNYNRLFNFDLISQELRLHNRYKDDIYVKRANIKHIQQKSNSFNNNVFNLTTTNINQTERTTLYLNCLHPEAYIRINRMNINVNKTHIDDMISYINNSNHKISYLNKFLLFKNYQLNAIQHRILQEEQYIIDTYPNIFSLNIDNNREYLTNMIISKIKINVNNYNFQNEPNANGKKGWFVYISDELTNIRIYETEAEKNDREKYLKKNANVRDWIFDNDMELWYIFFKEHRIYETEVEKNNRENYLKNLARNNDWKWDHELNRLYIIGKRNREKIYESNKEKQNRERRERDKPNRRNYRRQNYRRQHNYLY